MKLDGRIALVTGASRGIGRAAALALAREGAAVAVNYRSGKDQAEEAVKEISDAGGRAIADSESGPKSGLLGRDRGWVERIEALIEETT